jgi:hypothetical protein
MNGTSTGVDFHYSGARESDVLYLDDIRAALVITPRVSMCNWSRSQGMIPHGNADS